MNFRIDFGFQKCSIAFNLNTLVFGLTQSLAASKALTIVPYYKWIICYRIELSLYLGPSK